MAHSPWTANAIVLPGNGDNRRIEIRTYRPTGQQRMERLGAPQGQYRVRTLHRPVKYKQCDLGRLLSGRENFDLSHGATVLVNEVVGRNSVVI